MPQSARETALAALASLIEGAVAYPVARNTSDPAALSTAALVLHDGAAGDPEVTLSPLTYAFEHRAELDVIVQDEALKDTILDDVARTVGAAIVADRTLGGACDWCEAMSPTADPIRVPGAEAIKAAMIPIMVHYETDDPLN